MRCSGSHHAAAAPPQPLRTQQQDGGSSIAEPHGQHTIRASLRTTSPLWTTCQPTPPLLQRQRHCGQPRRRLVDGSARRSAFSRGQDPLLRGTPPGRRHHRGQYCQSGRCSARHTRAAAWQRATAGSTAPRQTCAAAWAATAQPQHCRLDRPAALESSAAAGASPRRGAPCRAGPEANNYFYQLATPAGHMPEASRAAGRTDARRPTSREPIDVASTAATES